MQSYSNLEMHEQNSMILTSEKIISFLQCITKIAHDKNDILSGAAQQLIKLYWKYLDHLEERRAYSDKVLIDIISLFQKKNYFSEIINDILADITNNEGKRHYDLLKEDHELISKLKEITQEEIANKQQILPSRMQTGRTFLENRIVTGKVKNLSFQQPFNPIFSFLKRSEVEKEKNHIPVSRCSRPQNFALRKHIDLSDKIIKDLSNKIIKLTTYQLLSKVTTSFLKKKQNSDSNRAQLLEKDNPYREEFPVNDVDQLIKAKKLNFWEKTALEYLNSHGLTEAMLLTRNNKGHKFDDSHCYALIKLVLVRQFSIQQALAEIDGLTTAQLEGIREDLTRDDVIKLKNFWHIQALGKLKDHGLTAEMLSNRNDQEHTFTDSHCYALIKLVLVRQFSIQQALTEIEGLTSSQARKIQEDLTREQILKNKKAQENDSITRLFHP